jgi:hypothetical protein
MGKMTKRKRVEEKAQQGMRLDVNRGGKEMEGLERG